MNSLNMADRAALRAVVGVGMMDPISHMYKELKIPTLQELNTIYVGKFMHRLFIKDLKGNFEDFWKKVGERVGRENLRNIDDFDSPQHVRFTHLKQFPLFHFPETFNKLTQELKNIPKPKTFANTFKKFVLSGGDNREAIELTDDILIN